MFFFPETKRIYIYVSIEMHFIQMKPINNSYISFIFAVKDMKSKAVERLTSVTLDTDSSEESEPEIIETKELDINNENTGLRRRNVGDSVSLYKRTISKMEEMELYDEDDVQEDIQLDKEDEEEVETGAVIFFSQYMIWL